MAKAERWLLYSDADDGELKIHGPMTAAQAEGFVSGVNWVNDSALEQLGDYSSLAGARKAATTAARSGPAASYEIEEMGFEVPALAVAKGELHLLYADKDQSLLKLHGPFNPGQAEGFVSGVEWVNDSALEYVAVFAGATPALAGAKQMAERDYADWPVEEMAFAVEPALGV